MLLSLILTFASLDPSLQAQASTQVTKTTDKVADHLGLRPATRAEILAAHPEIRAIFQEASAKAKAELATTPKFKPANFEDTKREIDRLTKELKDEVRKSKELANALAENNRKLEAQLLESQKLLESSKAP